MSQSLDKIMAHVGASVLELAIGYEMKLAEKDHEIAVLQREAAKWQRKYEQLKQRLVVDDCWCVQSGRRASPRRESANCDLELHAAVEKPPPCYYLLLLLMAVSFVV